MAVSLRAAARLVRPRLSPTLASAGFVGSCVQEGVFAVEQGQYRVSLVGDVGNYVLVSTWPGPPGVDQLDDAELQKLLITRYVEATSSAVEDAHVVQVAGRRVIVLALTPDPRVGAASSLLTVSKCSGSM